MPAFEGRLPAEDRWAAALYASVLRLPAPRGDVPPSLRAFPASGRMSDDEVLTALGTPGASDPAGAWPCGRRADLPRRPGGCGGRIGLRSGSPPARFRVRPRASRRPVGEREGIRRVHDLRAGRARCAGQEPGAGPELETAFASLRTRAAGGRHAGASWRRSAAARRRARERRAGAERPGLPAQSLRPVVRHPAARRARGHPHRRRADDLPGRRWAPSHRKRDIHIGVGAAVGASLVTAVALETIFALSPGPPRGARGRHHGAGHRRCCST